MTEPIYEKIIADLKQQINAKKFTNLKLPDERSLADYYQVSRSSVKRAMGVLSDSGMIFKKQGSGTFVNPLYLKNQSLFNYNGPNVGVTDSFQKDGQRPSIKVLTFEVIKPNAEVQEALFLKPDDFVYRIHRLRSFGTQPFMIENGFVPIKVIPDLNKKIVSGSLFNYLQNTKKQTVSKTFLTISADASNVEDQQLLGLKPTEPVGVMEGIFFLDNGTPLEFSRMRLHYQYMKYNTFVSVE